MASSAFTAALRFTLQQEGGFQNTYDDSGNWTGGAVGSGALVGTNFGISAAAYSNLDIATLTQADASAIYQRDYWSAIQGDALPEAIAIVTFDAAVNSGSGNAIRWLQAALGVGVDGVLGPVTLAAAQNASSSLGVASRCLVNRLDFLVANGFGPNRDPGLLSRIINCAFFTAQNTGA